MMVVDQAHPDGRPAVGRHPSCRRGWRPTSARRGRPTQSPADQCGNRAVANARRRGAARTARPSSPRRLATGSRGRPSRIAARSLMPSSPRPGLGAEASKPTPSSPTSIRISSSMTCPSIQTLARVAVTGRVADCFLDDPIGIDLPFGSEDARGQDPGIQSDVDRHARTFPEIVQRGTQSDLMDATGPQSSRPHLALPRAPRPPGSGHAGSSSQRLARGSVGRGPQRRLGRIEGQDHRGQRLADAVMEVPRQSCAFLFVGGVESIARLAIERRRSASPRSR